jgi:hypothetical protein
MPRRPIQASLIAQLRNLRWGEEARLRAAQQQIVFRAERVTGCLEAIWTGGEVMRSAWMTVPKSLSTACNDPEIEALGALFAFGKPVLAVTISDPPATTAA